MACCININHITIDISETELLGIFCHIFDIFGDHLTDPLFNVEVAYVRDGKLFHYDNQKVFHNIIFDVF
jgi:hypothetical protein